MTTGEIRLTVTCIWAAAHNTFAREGSSLARTCHRFDGEVGSASIRSALVIRCVAAVTLRRFGGPRKASSRRRNRSQQPLAGPRGQARALQPELGMTRPLALVPSPVVSRRRVRRTSRSRLGRLDDELGRWLRGRTALRAARDRDASALDGVALRLRRVRAAVATLACAVAAASEGDAIRARGPGRARYRWAIRIARGDRGHRGSSQLEPMAEWARFEAFAPFALALLRQRPRRAVRGAAEGERRRWRACAARSVRWSRRSSRRDGVVRPSPPEGVRDERGNRKRPGGEASSEGGTACCTFHVPGKGLTTIVSHSVSSSSSSSGSAYSSTVSSKSRSDPRTWCPAWVR